jgi:hypothetical protein
MTPRRPKNPNQDHFRFSLFRTPSILLFVFGESFMFVMSSPLVFAGEPAMAAPLFEPVRARRSDPRFRAISTTIASSKAPFFSIAARFRPRPAPKARMPRTSNISTSFGQPERRPGVYERDAGTFARKKPAARSVSLPKPFGRGKIPPRFSPDFLARRSPHPRNILRNSIIQSRISNSPGIVRQCQSHARFPIFPYPFSRMTVQ